MAAPLVTKLAPGCKRAGRWADAGADLASLPVPDEKWESAAVTNGTPIPFEG